MTPPTRLDLHVHSTHSPDGRSTVTEHAAQVAAGPLQGFALTDHNTTSGVAELREVRSVYPHLLLVPGVEVSTLEGHLLVYGVDEAPPPARPLEETVAWAVAHGGEAVLAHPYRWPHGAGRHVGGAGSLRAVEATNAHNPAGANARAAELARKLGLPTTGGSDAHQAREVGRASTVVPDGCASVDDVLEALRRGRVSAEGTSLSSLGWLVWGLRAGAARLGRGLRSV